MSESLEPDGEPPSPRARWCPKCRGWVERVIQHHMPAYEHNGRTIGPYTYYKPMPNRCPLCRTALVRPPKRLKLKPGELRPGVMPEW